MTCGLIKISVERQKQIKKYTDQHDDNHVDKEIIENAADCLQSYLNGKGGYSPAPGLDSWGLGRKYNKKPNKLLSIAGALIIAELDRLERKK